MDCESKFMFNTILQFMNEINIHNVTRPLDQKASQIKEQSVPKSII